MRSFAKLRAEWGQLLQYGQLRLVNPAYCAYCPQGKSHPLVLKHNLQLAALYVCANHCRNNESKLIVAAGCSGTSSVYTSPVRRAENWFVTPTLLDITAFLSCSIDEGFEHGKMEAYCIALLHHVFCRLLQVFPWVSTLRLFTSYKAFWICGELCRDTYQQTSCASCSE